MKLFGYKGKDGEFDYEYYRKVQEQGNKRKLASQWVDKETISYLAKFVLSTNSNPSFGLCHGTRQGNEQAWFAEFLPKCVVIGTEISETATQFPNTVQHDFHDEREEWIGKADFVYSNSWDHSFDPPKMFTAWLNQLSQGGNLILEVTPGHQKITELDPFGAEADELIELIGSINPKKFRFKQILGDAPGVLINNSKRIPAEYIIFERHE